MSQVPPSGWSLVRKKIDDLAVQYEDVHGLALLSSNALSMSEASIVCSKLKKVLDLAEFGNALAILAENGNNSIIEEPGLNAAKHWKQKTQIITRMQAKSL